MDKILITIPTRKREELLIKLLDSIRKYYDTIDIYICFQEYSSDKIKFIVEKYNVKYYDTFDKGLGVVKARKLGYEKAINSGYKYILDFDDDVIIKKGFIEQIYVPIEKYNNIAIASTPYMFNVSKTNKEPNKLLRIYCVGPAKIIRVEYLKKIINRILLDDCSIRDDMELCLEMFLLGHEVVYCGGPSEYRHTLGKLDGGIEKSTYREEQLKSALILKNRYSNIISIDKNGRVSYIKNLKKLGYIKEELVLERIDL
jgi:hypothetical protein